MRGSVGFHGDVVHVSGVGMRGKWIVDAVMRAAGVEVSPGRFKVRSNATGSLVEVDGVHARGKILEVQMEPDALLYTGGW